MNRLRAALVPCLAGALCTFVSLPLLALFFSTPLSAWPDIMRTPSALAALRVSLTTSMVSTSLAAVLGLPTAWWLSQRTSRTSLWLEAWLTLPTVIPPSVAGLTLLMAFGRQGLLGRMGVSVPSPVFTAVAVVLAQTFVAAPLVVQGALIAFRRIDADVLLVARTLGADGLRVFVRIALPLSRSGVIAAVLLAWARALGEFGATLMFAGNLEGVTQTLPLAIYTALEVDSIKARVLSSGLLAVAGGVLVTVKMLQASTRVEVTA